MASMQLDGVPPDQGFLQLEEVFHLEDQLPQSQTVVEERAQRASREPDEK